MFVKTSSCWWVFLLTSLCLIVKWELSMSAKKCHQYCCVHASEMNLSYFLTFAGTPEVDFCPCFIHSEKSSRRRVVVYFFPELWCCWWKLETKCWESTFLAVWVAKQNVPSRLSDRAFSQTHLIQTLHKLKVRKTISLTKLTQVQTNLNVNL